MSRRPFVLGLLALVHVASVAISSASEAIPVGPARMTIDAGVPLEVFTYRPPTFRDGPLVLVFHGVQRNAEDYRNFAIHAAERFDAIVAAPLFDRERFPYDDYQQGGILRDGRIRPREEWTFSRLPVLIAELRAATGDPERPFYILGHSAGGQFVVRLAAIAGSLGAERLVAGNPGSHLFPTRDAPYGYGFGGLPDELSGDDALRRYLAAPLTLYLGTGDDDPAHRSLDRRPPALAQGPHRYARGLACYAAARTLATERGWEFAWRLVETPGIDHDAARMFAAPEVADALFGADAP
jgi:poly(3-hydroxybutyrate) depolymerase